MREKMQKAVNLEREDDSSDGQFLTFLSWGNLLTHYCKLEALGKSFWQVNVRQISSSVILSGRGCQTKQKKIERKPPLKLLHLRKYSRIETAGLPLRMRTFQADVQSHMEIQFSNYVYLGV